MDTKSSVPNAVFDPNQTERSLCDETLSENNDNDIVANEKKKEEKEKDFIECRNWNTVHHVT